MRSEAYTVKLNTEIKEKWQNLISEMMKDYGIETIGEVYPVLIDIINNSSSKTSADLNEYIKNIRLNLESVLKNVMAIDGVYQSSAANSEQKLNEAKAALVLQLERESEANRKLTEELNKTKEKLERAESEVRSLKEEVEELKNNNETQQEILSLLSELKDKKEKSSDSKNKG